MTATVHPKLRHIKNLERKVLMPDPRITRLVRRCPVTLWRHGIQELIPFATTYGVLSDRTDAQFRFITGADRSERHAPHGDSNEFADNPKLLRLLCVQGKMTKADHKQLVS